MARHPIVADFISAEKLATDPPKPNPDETWQKRMNDKFRGKPKDKAKQNPPGMFTKSPSHIALDLKNHSPGGYDEAQKKLNSYINRQGRNLQGGDRKRLYDTKEHLKMNYGINDNDTSSSDSTSDSSSTEANVLLAGVRVKAGNETAMDFVASHLPNGYRDFADFVSNVRDWFYGTINMKPDTFGLWNPKFTADFITGLAAVGRSYKTKIPKVAYRACQFQGGTNAQGAEVSEWGLKEGETQTLRIGPRSILSFSASLNATRTFLNRFHKAQQSTLRMVVSVDVTPKNYVATAQSVLAFFTDIKEHPDYVKQKIVEAKTKAPVSAFKKVMGSLDWVLKDPLYKSQQEVILSFPSNKVEVRVERVIKKGVRASVVEVQADTQPTIYAPPLGHNQDDPTWDLLSVVPDNREKILSRTVNRLRASVQNSTQNPNTRMSAVEPVETDGASTVVNNLDETGIAPSTFGADDLAIIAPSPTGNQRGSTADGVETTFEEIKTPSNTAFASASSTLSKALGALEWRVCID